MFFFINFETNKIFLKASMTTKDGNIMSKKIKAFLCKINLFKCETVPKSKESLPLFVYWYESSY